MDDAGIPFIHYQATAILYVVMVKWMYPIILVMMPKQASWSSDRTAKLGGNGRQTKKGHGSFLFAILLWTIREPMSKQFSWFTLSDTGVAMLAALLIFALPTDLKNMKFVLDWSDTKTLPWAF